MFVQKCPSCRSSRIRRGYRATGLLSRLVFRYNLLCDGCNLEFRGFAFPRPSPRSARNKNKKKKKPGTVELNG